MSFEVEIRRTLGRFVIDRNFKASSGLTVLFGPSGSGKSSILNMIAGLLRPDSGRILVEGLSLFDSERQVNLPPEKRHIGYVFQDGRLFPHRRVRANLLYGYRLAQSAHRWLEPEQAIEFLGINHLLDRWLTSLSGGEAQRVAIGRALLAGPRAILMDEPLSFLDAARRKEVIEVIERIRDELKIPILYVTHDRAEAMQLANSFIEIG